MKYRALNFFLFFFFSELFICSNVSRMAKDGMPLYFDTGEDDDDNKSFVNFYATIQ